ncbi:relaxin-3-like [Ambystoma mexicanum]|uniref:relaxin-3-like n=1 Tax=Ambystoma mexicanum TaxID=8296 RepID=UPI0037E8A321
MLKVALWHLLCIGLLVASLPGDLNAQGAGGRSAAGAAGDYGVRLCGREFIRAVIFTCGGSRWKRLTLDVDPSDGAREQLLQQNAHRSAGSIQATSNKDLDSLKLQPYLAPDEEQQLARVGMPFGRQPIKDVFNVYEDYNAYVPASDDLNEYIRQVEEASQKARSGAGAAPPAVADRLPWINYPRRKRDYSMGVAGMCCKWGCSKAEISTLC